MIDCLDVSHHQDPAKFDWPALVARGIRIVVCRASYGAKTADRQFVKFHEAVKKHDLIWGPYLFYRQIHTVEEQMALFDRQLALIGGLVPGDLLPTLDMEENSANGDGRPNGKLFAESCYRIADAWRERYGGAILYYSSYFPEYLRIGGTLDYWTQNFRAGTSFHHWLADYNHEPGKPRTPYTTEWALHQPMPRKIPEYARGTLPVDVDAPASASC